jgi:hypothetical protein
MFFPFIFDHRITANPARFISISLIQNTMNAFATVEDIRKALTISPKEASAGAADKVIWQVFFLPIDDVNNPTGYAAFCPFTKILAYGSTINEAAQRWTRKAQREYKYLGVYSPGFIIPK